VPAVKTPALWFLLAVVFLLPARLGAATVLYSTGFEATQGYNPKFELIGQQGWVSDTTTLSGGNGLLTNFMGSQAAYVGLFPLNPPTNYLAVWPPLNYSPLATGMPVVKFSATIAIVDSTNGFRDDFFWSVYNSQGNNLFTVDFWNNDLGIYYALDGTNSLVFTGATFTNDVAYTLGITMDFARNRWSATLDGAPLVNDQLITTTNAPLNLGDIDALWVIGDAANPGDNFMIFDNYRVTAEAEPAASLSTFGRTANGQFLLRLNGPSGARYAIDASADLRLWSALKTNTVTDGAFDYVDTSAAGFAKRYYRARLVP
jgi:hypothetical protein